MARKWFALLAAAGVAATLAVPASASVGSQSSVLGKKDKATGTPVTVGIISSGKGEAIDNTGQIKGGEAAADYANDYLAGLAGHPVEVEVCTYDGTPAGATDCATQMVDAEVAAVVVSNDANMTTIYEGLTGSGIPLVAGASNDQAVLLGSDAFVLQNGLGFAIAGPAALAESDDVTKAAVVVIDVPSAADPYNSIGKLIYQNAGVDLQVVTVPPGTADMTPQIQAALSESPELFSVVGDPTFCTSALKALKTVGYDGNIVVIPQCIDAGTAKAVPGGLKGVTVVTQLTNDPKSDEYKKFVAIMKKYAKGTSLGGVTPDGYSTMLGFITSLSGITGDVTAASVQEALKAMQPTPLPLGEGIQIQCNSPISIVPNVCSTEVLAGPLNKAGIMQSADVLQTEELIQL